MSQPTNHPLTTTTTSTTSIDYPATNQTQRQQPTKHEINLLSQIVLQAQSNPLSQKSPREALFSAYEDVFAEKGLDLSGKQDTICLWVLRRMIELEGGEGNGSGNGSLYERFEGVLRELGIELAFEDDEVEDDGGSVSARETAPSLTEDIPENDREYETQVSSVKSADIPIPQIATKYPPAEVKLDDFDDYMDNPPPGIADLMKVAEAKDRRTLLRQTLDILQTRNVARMERQADDYYNSNLSYKVLTHWRNVAVERAMDYAQADLYCDNNLKLRSLSRLGNAARIQRIQAMEEERLKGMAMYKMTLASREAQFVRQKELNLKWKFLGKLITSMRAKQAQQSQLETVLQQRETVSRLRVLRPTLNLLAGKIDQIKAIDTTAQHHYETKLRSTVIHQWHGRNRELNEKVLMANDMREYFLMRKYLFKLKEAAEAKRNRRMVLVKWTIQRWRNFINIKKHQTYDTNYKLARRTIKMNLARRHLRLVVEETTRLKDLNRIADECRIKRTRKIAHNAIITMYNRSQQIKQFTKQADTHANHLSLKHAMGTITHRTSEINQLDQIANRYQTLHKQRIAVHCLKQLSMRSFEIQRRKQDADAFRSRHDKKLARITLDRMRTALAESRGEGPLRLPPATPSQKRAEELLRLSSTTPRYTPAVFNTSAGGGGGGGGGSNAAITTTRASNFAARLRGETGIGIGGPIAERILEEGEDEEMEMGVDDFDGNIGAG